jgi:hypothetical protein
MKKTIQANTTPLRRGNRVMEIFNKTISVIGLNQMESKTYISKPGL